MKNRVVFCILMMLFITIVTRCQSSVKDEMVLDDSGALAFIKLCRSTQSINIDMIDKLLNLPPYRRMMWWTKNNWYGLDKQEWRNIFAVALVPEKYSLQEDLQKPQFQKVVDQIKKVKDSFSEIEQYLREIRKVWNPTEIIVRVRKYLPEDAPTGPFRVNYIVGLGQAGGAYKSECIMDAFIDMNRPIQKLMRGIAHEAHHSYRMLLKTEDYVEESQYKGIMQALFWLETEGIADMVAFDGMNQEEILNFMREGWRPIYEHADTYLARLDKAIRDIFMGVVTGENTKSHITMVLSTNNAYHPVGFKMAQRIETQLGHEAHIDCVGKPYKFLVTYQQAAKKIGNSDIAYIFGDDVILKLGRINWHSENIGSSLDRYI